MPYSTGCATPLSNFEATQDYKEVQDPAITVCFPLDDEPDVNIIAWTTTPWTLPSNLALCVHPELDYVKVKVRSLQLMMLKRSFHYKFMPITKIALPNSFQFLHCRIANQANCIY